MPHRADGTQVVHTFGGRESEAGPACVAGARWQMSLVEVSLSAPHVPAHPRLPGRSSGPFWRKDPSSCRTRPASAAPSHAWALEKGNRQSFSWASSPAGPQDGDGGGPGRVGSVRDPAGGKEVTSRLWGLFRPLLIYLFIFPTVPGRGWPQGLGGRGGRRRERERGEAHSPRDRSGELAPSGRQAGGSTAPHQR